MTTIYNSPVLHVTYDEKKERAILYKKNGFNSTSVAYLLNTDESSCWDNFKAFVLKYFTWTWISVKDSGGNDTDQLININSIVMRVGLTAQEIEVANKAGTLFDAIDVALREKDIPNTDALLAKKQKAQAAFMFIDESNQFTFLATFEKSCKELPYPSPTPFEDLPVLLANYAIAEFKYVDVALDWVKVVASVFVPQSITAKATQELMDLVK